MCILCNNKDIKTMKLAVIGSRSIKETKPVTDILERLNTEVLISGGAVGVDTTAQRYAELAGIETVIIKPNYEKYGKLAPLKRNEEIVNTADIVLAIWDGKSTGTLHAINYARLNCKMVRVVNLGQKDQTSLF
jgi:hypothetical protein